MKRYNIDVRYKHDQFRTYLTPLKKKLPVMTADIY